MQHSVSFIFVWLLPGKNKQIETVAYFAWLSSEDLGVYGQSANAEIETFSPP